MKKVIYGVRIEGGAGVTKTFNFYGVEGINLHDTVVVDTKGGLMIGTVVSTDAVIKPTKWIIAYFNLEKFKAFAEKEERKETLKKAMNEQFLSHVTMENFANLAANDDKMKALLNEYMELDND